MTFHNIRKRNGALFTLADPGQDALGQIQILRHLEELEDGFTGVEGLGAPGAFGQSFKAFFDPCRKPNGQHWKPPCYTSIA